MGGRYSVLPQIPVIVLSQILLHGIVRNFACNILTLKDNTDINFAGIARWGRCSHNFSRNFEITLFLVSDE